MHPSQIMGAIFFSKERAAIFLIMQKYFSSMICVMVFLCVKGRGGLFESTLVIRFPIYLSLDMLGFSQSQLRDWAGPMILMPVLEIKRSYFWQCTYYSEDGLPMFFMDYGRPRTGQHVPSLPQLPGACFYSSTMQKQHYSV